MTDLSRRAFLGSAVALGAGGLLVACGRESTSDAQRPGPVDSSSERSTSQDRFHGVQQHGVTASPPPAARLTSFDAVAPTTAALATGFGALSERIRSIVDADSHVHSINASVGASLFDERYGLAERAPNELVAMPPFGNDAFDPTAAHGDVLLSISGAEPEAVDRARLDLEAGLKGAFTERWTVAGTNGVSPEEPHPRNPMGFHDGTSNPPVDVPGRMRQVVWVQPRDGEPEWASDGTYQAVRIIRMDLDRWDAVEVPRQEAIIGRRKADGAPLGGGTIDDVPDHRTDPQGTITPLDAHVRLANPRNESIPYDEIVRRGFTYTRSQSTGGEISGLAFVSYQRSLESGFLDIQRRLEGEPLEEFTATEGGGFYFVLPGVLDPDDWLGRTLLEGV